MNWLRSLSLLPLTAACGGAVDVGSIDTTSKDAASDRAITVDAGPSDPVSGMPCSSLHGTAVLRTREIYGWPACAYSFRFATQDDQISKGNYDVCLDRGFIDAILVSGDPSAALVDLGDVPLTTVPSMVEPTQFPVDRWGKHESVSAVAGHTYFERLVRLSGDTIAAFRVTAVSSSQTTLEWIRSPNPSAMVVPTACLK